LEEALKRLEDGSLPPRSVVLTFDDGFADFYRVAWPILRDFGFPATLYLTTYYMLRGLPVFDPALDYLLWKGRGRILDWPGISQQAVPTDPARRREMSCMLSANVLKRELTATQKDIFLEDLAERLGQDYAALRESRALSLITEGEARKLSAEGANLQLHTHRHRTSNQQDRFLREIIDNRECMAAMGLRPTEHFCYPSGVRRVNDAQWLDELGIKSAATCQPGLVAPGSEPHSLPRVVDSAFTETEFLGWLHGTSALLPRREWSPEIVAVTEPVDTELLASSSAAHR
jgi:peptidoglycan/xylan/chitin deacetylase (PgdA/CDA1 family)